MTLKESIVKDLEGLPKDKLIEIARHVYRLNPRAQEERREMLKKTFGCLDEEDGKAFEEALRASRGGATSG